MSVVFRESLSPLMREAEIIRLESESMYNKIEAMERMYESLTESRYMEAEARVLYENGTDEDLYHYYMEAEDSGNKTSIIQSIVNWFRTQLEKFTAWLGRVCGNKNERLQQLAGTTVKYNKVDKNIFDTLRAKWSGFVAKLKQIASDLESNHPVATKAIPSLVSFGLGLFSGDTVGRERAKQEFIEEDGQVVADDAALGEQVLKDLGGLVNRFDQISQKLLNMRNSGYEKINKVKNDALDSVVAKRNAKTGEEQPEETPAEESAEDFVDGDYMYEAWGRNPRKKTRSNYTAPTTGTAAKNTAGSEPVEVKVSNSNTGSKPIPANTAKPSAKDEPAQPAPEQKAAPKQDTPPAQNAKPAEKPTNTEGQTAKPAQPAPEQKAAPKQDTPPAQNAKPVEKPANTEGQAAKPEPNQEAKPEQTSGNDSATTSDNAEGETSSANEDQTTDATNAAGPKSQRAAKKAAKKQARADGHAENQQRLDTQKQNFKDKKAKNKETYKQKLSEADLSKTEQLQVVVKTILGMLKEIAATLFNAMPQFFKDTCSWVGGKAKELKDKLISGKGGNESGEETPAEDTGEEEAAANESASMSIFGLFDQDIMENTSTHTEDEINSGWEMLEAAFDEL